MKSSNRRTCTTRRCCDCVCVEEIVFWRQFAEAILVECKKKIDRQKVEDALEEEKERISLFFHWSTCILTLSDVTPPDPGPELEPEPALPACDDALFQ